jgi:hypothetical protein
LEHKKEEYVSPELFELGSAEDLTHGGYFEGSIDSDAGRTKPGPGPIPVEQLQ